MDRSVAPDATPPTVTVDDAAERRRRASTSARSRPPRSTSRCAPPASPRPRSAHATRRNALVPSTVSYDAPTAPRRSRRRPRSPTASTYTRDRQGRRRRRRRLAGNALAADVTWTFTTESSPPPILVVGSTTQPVHDVLGEILRHEGLNAFTTLDSRCCPPCVLSYVRRRAARRDAADAGAGVHADELGQRRRQPDRAAPGQAARRPARPHRRRHDARQRLPEGRHDDRGGRRASSAARSSSTARPTATRSAARTAVATLYSNAATATANPAVTLRVGRLERRPGGGVHLRPRPLDRLHAPGQPGVGGPGA